MIVPTSKRDSGKVHALLDRLYSIAMRGNVAAAALYFDRVLGPVRVPVEVGAPRRDESAVVGAGRAVTIARPEPEPSNPKRLLSVAEVAELVGISKGMVYRLQKTGRLKVCRVGRRVLVPAEDVERLIDS